MRRKRYIFLFGIMSVLFAIGNGLPAVSGSSLDCNEAGESQCPNPNIAAISTADTRSTGTSPLVPAFAERSRVPASGKQGPPGSATGLAGNWKKGELLFARHCQSCHGPLGTDKVANPGSADGTVPPLNPVDPDIADKNPLNFIVKIDRYIQHGSMPDGRQPMLFMPDWGDSKTLSQSEIASIEAYILRLNGMKRKK